MKTYFIATGNSPETNTVEVLSPELLYTLEGKDCVCVVSSGSDTSIVEPLANAVISNPKAVYGLVGTWVDTDGKGDIRNSTSVIVYDRRPSKQRFLNDDTGNVKVHFFHEICYAFNPSKVNCLWCLDNVVFSDYLEHAGIERIVINTDFWKGPRLPGNRYVRMNLSVQRFSGLTGKYIPIPRNATTAGDFNGQIIQKPDETQYVETTEPEVMVMMTTHNRTETALKTIESLVTHLKYPKLRWCICDDRSQEGHVAKLADRFADLGVEDVKICRTNSEHWGLGASMNNGLREAFKIGPVVLTTEDDWLLTKDLDIKKWVSFLIENTEAACVRLGFTWLRKGILDVEDTNFGLKRFVYKNGNLTAWTVTNQVAIRHRRMYDLVGLYKENCHPDISEGDMRTRVNASRGLSAFWPDEFPVDTMSDPRLPFLHFGVSTVGHEYGKNGETLGIKPFFRIITPTYNTNDLLVRCARSLDRQTFRDFVWIIVDDNSTDNTPNIIEDLAKTRPWIKYVLLKKHVDAGGARNVATSLSDSEYTLYLDSDDFVYDDNSLSEIYKTIVRSFPDIVRLVRFDSGKMFDAKPNTVEELSMLNPGPPQLCHKTSLQQKFVSNRRKYNDVVWFLRTCDISNTIDFCPHAYFEYRHDCKFSGHTGSIGQKDIRSIAAGYYLIGDLLSERFTKEYSVRSAQATVEWFSKRGIVKMTAEQIKDAFATIRKNMVPQKESTRCAVLTLTTSGREWMTDRIFTQNKKMCEKMNADFIVESYISHKDRPPSWNKIPLIRSYLKKYDIVFWVDDDAVILRPFSITGILTDANVAIAEGNMELNAGVMAFRNTEDSTRLLDWVDKTGYELFGNDPDWEQRAVIKYANEKLNKKKFKKMPWGEYNASPRIRKINSQKGYLSDATKILHFAGIKKDKQKEDIEKILDLVLS